METKQKQKENGRVERESERRRHSEDDFRREGGTFGDLHGRGSYCIDAE